LTGFAIEGHPAVSPTLRLFVNLDYLRGAPPKLGVACAIGVVMGTLGGSLRQLTHRRIRCIIATA
jgi:hypothetical protein